MKSLVVRGRGGAFAQRVHVGIWYILRAQRGSHIPTLRPKYIPYTYMDPLGWTTPSGPNGEKAYGGIRGGGLRREITEHMGIRRVQGFKFRV